jgi:zinc protease
VRGPRPGRVLAEEYTPGIGVVRWTLSNGARVVLRRWGGDDRGVRLLAVSRGGLSLVPDSLFAEALAAPLVVSSGGAGELSAPELERLSGGEVELSFYVDAAGEGISGNAEPGRLKDLLRMVHLHFTAPRLDTAAWNVTVRRLQSAFSGRSNDPAQVFADTLSALLGTDDPRLPSVTPESLARVDPVRAVQVFRERFANASDFTFYLAGEMEPEQVRPWVERYLASLPGARVREVPRDLGARPPAGVAVRTVRAGRAEAGAVAIVFSGEAKHSREARGELEGLAEVLQHRLHARLRDELGLVYEQDVTWWMGNVPVPSYQVTVFIPAAPERLQEVTRIVFESVDSLRAHGGSPDEVLRVRGAARRAYEDGRSTNGFWVNALREADENGWDAGDASLPSSSTRLTRRRVAEAARRYLNPRQYVQVMLLPADVPPPAPPKPEAGSPRD